MAFIYSCCENVNNYETIESKSETKTELVTGGLYASENSDGTYGISKILALEENGVHVRMYNESFD